MLRFLQGRVLREAFLSGCRDASRSICITTYTFYPLLELRNSLEGKDCYIVVNFDSRLWRSRGELRKRINTFKGLASMRYHPMIHAKLAIFDSSTVIVSSMNLTRNSLYRMHEAGIITDVNDIVIQSLTYFDNLWKKSKVL